MKYLLYELIVISVMNDMTIKFLMIRMLKIQLFKNNSYIFLSHKQKALFKYVLKENTKFKVHTSPTF